MNISELRKANALALELEELGRVIYTFSPGDQKLTINNLHIDFDPYMACKLLIKKMDLIEDELKKLSIEVGKREYSPWVVKQIMEENITKIEKEYTKEKVNDVFKEYNEALFPPPSGHDKFGRPVYGTVTSAPAPSGGILPEYRDIMNKICEVTGGTPTQFVLWYKENR